MFSTLLQKHKNFTWAVRPKNTLLLFFVREHYEQRATAPTIDRQTLRRCELERELGGAFGVCVCVCVCVHDIDGTQRSDCQCVVCCCCTSSTYVINVQYFASHCTERMKGVCRETENIC